MRFSLTSKSRSLFRDLQWPTRRAECLSNQYIENLLIQQPCTREQRRIGWTSMVSIAVEEHTEALADSFAPETTNEPRLERVREPRASSPPWVAAVRYDRTIVEGIERTCPRKNGRTAWERDSGEKDCERTRLTKRFKCRLRACRGRSASEPRRVIDRSIAENKPVSCDETRVRNNKAMHVDSPLTSDQRNDVSPC